MHRFLLARFGCVCCDCYAVAVVRFDRGRCDTAVHLRRAVRYGYSIVDILIICGRRDCVCRHRKGDFGFGLVIDGYAFNRPARKLLARFGCGCRYRNAVAVVCGRLVRRTARD